VRVLVACEYSGRVREINMHAKPIPGFAGYLVSATGEVYGSRTNFGLRDHYRRLRPSTDSKGYSGLTICGDSGKRRKVRVHRLVAELFVPNPHGKPCVRHLDGNPNNNRSENLGWGTYAENEGDKRAHGTYDLRRTGKLSEGQRLRIKEMAGSGVPQKRLAEIFSVSRPTITRLLNGSTWA